ncbi:hypothetical protein B0T25DRAFT_592393 [Lasiosphaeria hispida]|uniref:Uncharacterized protein n=1 Tax=Lasiosphaeria hispida TaxID=260671 RepID=A0AAJ0MAP4_9PEZI|nr:hypothetical protein B0T25DRAFT_592393 [Lasiosphaeria hispida]
MVQPTRPPANAFVFYFRESLTPSASVRGTTSFCSSSFFGALLGFSPSRLILASSFIPLILPGAILACCQFVPLIRHKAIIVRRINGYIVILLSLARTTGVLITRHAAGESLETQAGLGLLSIMFVTSLILAFINTKRLQIEQHRAWMLRACRTFRVKNINQYAVVDADYADPSSAAEAAVALEISFGIALWIALAIHAAGIEIYLHLTPAEAERIRHFSYKRQIEAGMRHPGRAGTTSDQLGLFCFPAPQHIHRQ